MGDSPPVLLTAITTESSASRIVDAPWIDDAGNYAVHPQPRALSLYDTVDTRVLFADFWARLALLR